MDEDLQENLFQIGYTTYVWSNYIKLKNASYIDKFMANWEKGVHYIPHLKSKQNTKILNPNKIWNKIIKSQHSRSQVFVFQQNVSIVYTNVNIGYAFPPKRVVSSYPISRYKETL